MQITIALVAVLLGNPGQPASSQSVQALLQEARREMRDGQPSTALESLSKARTLAPNSEEVLSAYAQVSLTARAITPAILTLEALVRICPTVAQYHHMLGVALMQAGDLVAALDSLRQAEKLEPNSAPTLVALGVTLNAQNSYSDAQEVLLRALALEPENPDTAAALAEAEEALGELDDAEARAQGVLGKSPMHAGANLVIGMVRLKQDRFAEARDTLEKAATANPASPKVQYQLSLACARLGDAAASEKHRELYQQLMREADERVRELRTQRGIPGSAR
jgi:Flp pilus assembly protein TadD